MATFGPLGTPQADSKVSCGHELLHYCFSGSEETLGIREKHVQVEGQPEVERKGEEERERKPILGELGLTKMAMVQNKSSGGQYLTKVRGRMCGLADVNTAGDNIRQITYWI